MKHSLSSETRTASGIDQVMERVREVVHDVIAPEAAAVDAEARWPEAGIRALQEAGLGGLVVPADAGGLGGGLYTLVRVCEEIGRACASTGLCYGMHCVGTAVIAAKATGYQREQYLVPISQGTHLTTLALSEPGTGAHFYFPQMQLQRGADGRLVVNGVKSFVTNGGHADSYVMSVVAAEAEQPAGELACVVVRDGTPGMQWGAPWHGLGMRGNASTAVELKDVRLPEEDLLGRPGDQIWYVFYVVAPYFLVAMSATYLGLAQAALDQAREHVKSRHYGHSGRSLSELSVLQHRVGTLWSLVERTRRLIYFAAHEGDAGGPDALPALCSAKAEVAECAVEVINESMTLMGGIAYGENATMGRLLRDARAAHVMSPTTDILRTWVGRAVLGQPLLGD